VKVLVAGIGNIFFADDGFGVEVVRRLGACSVPPGTRVADYGIRGVHLAYELLDGYDLLVLVDAVPMGQSPGTVAVIEVDMDDLEATGDVAIDAHTMTPAAVLGTLNHLGGRVDRVLVVGCQPAVIGEGVGLSVTVAIAVDGAVDAVLSVLADAFATAGKES
jgi:hydrogenase maturation protease